MSLGYGREYIAGVATNRSEGWKKPLPGGTPAHFLGGIMGFSNGISMPINLERKLFMTDSQEREAELEIKRQVTELFDVSNRLEFIDVINNSLSSEYGTEPNAMIRTLAEFGTAMRDLDAGGINRAYQRINEWLLGSAESWVRFKVEGK